jgi:hypothetical protein
MVQLRARHLRGFPGQRLASGSAKEDNHILKFTNKGKFLMQIGHAGKNRGSNDTENLGGPAGLFVYRKTNELFVADGYFDPPRYCV